MFYEPYDIPTYIEPNCCQTRRGAAKNGLPRATRSKKAGFAAAIRWSGADQKRVKAAAFHLKPLFRVETAGSEIRMGRNERK